MTLAENVVLSAHRRMGLLSSIFIRAGAAARVAGEIVKAFDVRTPGTAASAASLSGGNLQKFIVGREILQKPKVLLVPSSEVRRVGKVWVRTCRARVSQYPAK